jgi:TRAP-type C4-dicarboxylate transport system substrate-binding protein
VALAALAPCFAAAAPGDLRLGTIAPDGSPYADGTKQFVREVEKLTRGAVRIKVFTGGILGDEPVMIAALTAGKLDFFSGTAGGAQAAIPELSVYELPFLFDDEREVDHVMRRTFPLLARAIAAHGYRLIAVTTVGFKHLGTQVPVETLADLRKLRLRSQPNAAQERFWARIGVKHTPIGQTQVLEEMAAGNVDAFDAAVTWMFAASWHTRIKYLTLSAHSYQAGLVIAGPAGLAKIPAALQDTAFRGGEQLGWANARQVRDVERSLLDALPGMGVTVRPRPAGLPGELEATSRELRAEWRKTASKNGRLLLDRIEAELAKLRRAAR